MRRLVLVQVVARLQRVATRAVAVSHYAQSHRAAVNTTSTPQSIDYTSTQTNTHSHHTFPPSLSFSTLFISYFITFSYIFILFSFYYSTFIHHFFFFFFF